MPTWAVRAQAALAAIVEREAPRLTIWSPVLLVIGIWAYFNLLQEPGWPLALALMVAIAIIVWRFRSVPLAVALALVFCGFAAAKLRTAWVETPLVRAYAADVTLTGRVLDADRLSAKRLMLVVDVASASGIPPVEVPRRVRLQVTGKIDTPHIGDQISGSAVLLPLPLPVAPGAFDYGRSLFFQSVGATGRFTAVPVVTEADVPPRYRLRRGFHALRAAIGARIAAVIEGPLGSFADALITGERARIPRTMNDSLQASGLFHILSISGLHMAMVAGSAFWLVRAVLALSPTLALRRPIKKWAAAAALVIGGFYMLLADGGAATERSFIMIAVMFFAVMVDRPAISLHNLAVAAVIILLLSPEQAVAASFQMSFLAVMGLAAFFEWWNARADGEVRQQRGLVWRTARRLWQVAVASLATSLIAGTLSSIPAAHHFGRLALYSVISNALALPVVSVAVMPMALLSALLMPFGMEAVPLMIMEQGLRLVMVISDWVAGWPSAGLALPLLSAGVAAALSFSAAFVAMPRSALRWLALPAAGLAMFLAVQRTSPDILVEERAQMVAAVDAGNALVPLPLKRGTFAVNRWLAARGQHEKAAAAAKRPLWTCDASQCRADVKGHTVVFLRETAEVLKPCPRAEVVIAQYPLRRRCKGSLATIDRFDVWRNGAHALTFTGGGVTVETTRARQGQRPWSVTPRPRAK
jgi:competence protein ComEC